jgi:hypothetical protein
VDPERLNGECADGDHRLEMGRGARGEVAGRRRRVVTPTPPTVVTRRAQEPAVHPQAGLSQQATGGERDLGRRVVRPARRAEDLGRGVAREDAATGDQEVRRLRAQREVDGGVGGHVDVAEQAAESRPAQPTAGEPSRGEGLGSPKRLLEHATSTDPRGRRFRRALRIVASVASQR